MIKNRKSPTLFVVGLVVLTPLAGVIVFSEPTSAVTFIEDDITQDTTWTAADSPFRVVGDITVQDNATLTIEPGANVEVASDVTITVAGTLRAEGEESNKIHFSSSQPTKSPGDWKTIKFTGGDGELLLIQHVDLAFATNGVTIEADSGQVRIESSRLHNNSEAGIRGIGGIKSGSVTVRQTTLDNNQNGIAHDLGNDAWNWLIEDSTIENNEGDGIDFGTRNIRNFTIRGSTIESNGNGIELYVNDLFGSVRQTHVVDDVTITGSKVQDNSGEGIAIYTETDRFRHPVRTRNVVVSDNTIRDNGANGLLVYSYTEWDSDAVTKNIMIRDNTIRNSANNGISVYSTEEDGNGATKNITIKQNTITGATNAVNLETEASVTEASNLTDNGLFTNDVGVFIGGPFTANLSLNNIAFNDQHGVQISESSNTVVRKNNIYENKYGLNVTNGAQVDAESNYWGASSGPFHPSINPSGEGNPVNGDLDSLDFIPFLRESAGGLNKAPTPNLSAEQTSATPGQEVTFDGSGSTDDGAVSEYRFEFGDGTTSGWTTTAHVVHTYDNPGTYQVNLTVRDDAGIESVRAASVTIEVSQKGPPPVVGDQKPTDPDGDGVYEDMDGDGSFGIVDVQTFFVNRDSSAIKNNVNSFDFSGDGQVTIADVQQLFVEFTES